MPSLSLISMLITLAGAIVPSARVSSDGRSAAFDQREPDIRTFLPSTHGFRFRNSFSGSPLQVSLGKLGESLGIPQNYGLCGGMSAAAADFFLARRTIPAQSNVPSDSESLYDYIYTRQMDSLGDAFRYALIFLRWMEMRDEGIAGTRSRSIPCLGAVRDSIDAGKPIMLGLVFSTTRKGKLWENHQVMAYDLSRTPVEKLKTRSGFSGVTDWSIHIYDPNFPKNDGVRIDLRASLEGVVHVPWVPGCRAGMPLAIFGIKATRVAPGRPEAPIRGVFPMPYKPRVPDRNL